MTRPRRTALRACIGSSCCAALFLPLVALAQSGPGGDSPKDFLALSCPATASVGQAFSCNVEAMLRNGQVDAGQKGQVSVSVVGDDNYNPPLPVTLSGGKATFSLVFTAMPPQGSTSAFVVVSTSDTAPTDQELTLTQAPPQDPAACPDPPPGITPPTDDTLKLTCAASSVAGDPVPCTLEMDNAKKTADTSRNDSVTFTLSGGQAGYDTPHCPRLSNGSATFSLLFTSVPSDKPDPMTVKVSAGGLSDQADISVLPSGTYNGGSIFRLVGGEQAVFYGAGQTSGRPFGDLYYETGLFCGGVSPQGFCGMGDAGDFGSPMRVWLEADMFAKNSSYASLTSTSATLTDVASAAEAFQVRFGGSLRFASPKTDLGGIPHGGDRSAVELIWGGGATSPDAPASESSSSSSGGGSGSQTNPLPPVYCLAPAGCLALTGNTGPTALTPEYLVVLPAARIGFLWNWEAGLRLQTFYSHLTDSDQPAVTDITIGENAAVTEGHVHYPVLGVEGFWPLPGSADFIFLTFDASVQMGGRGIGYQFPFNLTPAITSGYTGPLTGPAFLERSYVENGDEFRVGLTVDIVDFIKNHAATLFAEPKSGS